MRSCTKKPPQAASVAVALGVGISNVVKRNRGEVLTWIEGKHYGVAKSIIRFRCDSEIHRAGDAHCPGRRNSGQSDHHAIVVRPAELSDGVYGLIRRRRSHCLAGAVRTNIER